MANKYTIDMCNGPLLPGILRCALPLILTNLLQLFYNAVDIIVVGRYSGETALAAVGSTSALIGLIINLFIGISVGVSIVTSQYIGAKNSQKTFDTVHTAMLLALIGGIFFAVLGFFLTKPLLVLTDSPKNVMKQAKIYMQIYLLGAPALMIGNFGSSILRSVGDTKRPLYIFSAAGILNAVLNLIFIIKFKMGVEGVALATIISQYISAVLIVYILTKTDGYVTFYIRKARIKKEILLELLKKGFPVGIQSISFSLSNVLIQSAINSFGSVVIAGVSAAGNIEGFLLTILNSIGVVTTTFVAQNFGAKKYNRIDKTLLLSLGIVLVSGLLADVICIPFQRFLLGIYAPGNESAIDIGITRFKYVFNLYFICGFMEVISGVIRGLGKTQFSMFAAIIGIVIIRIIWIYTVFVYFKTLDSLFISYPVSWIITFIFMLTFYFNLRKKFFANKKESL